MGWDVKIWSNARGGVYILGKTSDKEGEWPDFVGTKQEIIHHIITHPQDTQ